MHEPPARLTAMIFMRYAFFLSLLLLSACGDPSDRPEDCTANEYFDQGDKLCVSCPALIEPSCREGCGFEIIKDSLGCPEAICDETCSICEEGSSWVDESLSCEPEDASQ